MQNKHLLFVLVNCIVDNLFKEVLILKTIHIAEQYYIGITSTNYIAMKFSANSKNLPFKKPSYHATFESALENILKRMEKDALTDSQNNVQTLHEAIEQIRKVREQSAVLIRNATDTHNALNVSEGQIEDNGNENDDEEIKEQIETDSQEDTE